MWSCEAINLDPDLIQLALKLLSTSILTSLSDSTTSTSPK